MWPRFPPLNIGEIKYLEHGLVYLGFMHLYYIHFPRVFAQIIELEISTEDFVLNSYLD